MTDHGSIVEYARAHAVRLSTLDPDAPLDDMEPVEEMIGDARVVAIGENTHHVREFYLARHRFLRFLVERCRFTHFANEGPFTAGIAVNDWVQGGAGDVVDLATVGMAFGMGECGEMQDILRWMRKHNETAATPLVYSGVDPPQTMGSLVPALDAVSRYLAPIDPETVAIVERVRTIAVSYEGVSVSVAVPRYDALDRATQQDLTATLSYLVHRFRAMRVHYVGTTGFDAYGVALRHLESATALDIYLQELASRLHGQPILAEGSIRDAFMAESVEWLLDRGGPSSKVIVAGHNAHTSRTPAMKGGRLSIYVQGSYLAHRFGDDFVSLALTSGGGTTVRFESDEHHPFGARLYEVPVGPPVEGSIEAVLAEAQTGLSVLDLRPLRARGVHIAKMNMAEVALDLPVVEAFDGVVLVPGTSASSFLTAHVP
jgi:erythromycin esterase